jgi:hypothetical protein
MRVASVKPDELALVDGEEFVLIRDLLVRNGVLLHQASMIDFISQYDSLKNILDSLVSTAKRVRLDPAVLKPPVTAVEDLGGGFQLQARHERHQGLRRPRRDLEVYAEQGLEMTFLKPPSAVIGPEQTILIPKGERVV